MKNTYTILLVLSMCATATAQTNTFPSFGAAGIGTTTPDASSLLDVTSTSKGILLPRMTLTQRNSIASPAQGLLIFQTNSTPGFYYYTGAAWTPVSVKGASTTLNNLTSPTAVNQDILPDATNTRNLGSSALLWQNVYLYNLKFSDGTTQSTAFTPYTAGTGISITGNNITNSSPDQIVSLTAGSGVSISGAYPSFTISATGGGSGANTSLSNLVSPTAVNVNLLPSANNTKNLGSSTVGWKNLYLGGSVYLGGVRFLSTGSGSGNNNTAVGDSVLNANTTGYTNTGIGNNALISNNTGFENTACGAGALYSNKAGADNSAFGRHALYFNTGGSDNTADGLGALYANQNGVDNTAVGYQGLYNSDADYNTAVGWQALYSNTTGFDNTATGERALYNSNSTYGFNTADGQAALYNNTTGYQNTADGADALQSNVTGAYNTALGFSADVFTGALDNATAIGYNATVDFSNQVRIGNSSVSSNGGQVSWTAFSDGRIKNDVKENVPGLKFINELRPVTFHYDVKKENALLGVKDTSNWEGKYDIEKIQFTGFIAQEVDAAAQKINYDFSGIDKSGNVWGLRYSDFVVPLVKAVQELDSMNGKLTMENGELKSANEQQQKQIDELKSKIDQVQSSIDNQKSSMSNGYAKLQISNLEPQTLLGQNIPNPFDNSTLIPFRIPKDCKDASIMITNTSTSEVISLIPISCNEDHVSIDAGTLASGSYSYTLYVDGKLIDTKNMILTK